MVIMRKPTVIFSILIMFLLLTSVASAAGPDVGAFSTTGYSPTFSFVDDFIPLPTGHIKFHILAEGDPADAVCNFATAATCGTDDFFANTNGSNGSFSFEEWGLYYPGPVPTDQGDVAGANHGLLNVVTDVGDANMRFGGLAVVNYGNPPSYVDAVGSFQVTDGSGDYKKLKGQGAYAGDADFVFTVDYTPTAELQGCAVFGSDLKLKKDKIEWEIENESVNDLTASSISLWWPIGTPLDKVKYGGKTVFDQSNDTGYAAIDLSTWTGKDKDIQLKANKKEKLTFEFATKPISENPWDYTILVEFSNGCAVPFVAFD